MLGCTRCEHHKWDGIYKGALTPIPMLQRKHRETCYTAVMGTETSGDGVCHRCIWHLKVSMAQLFGLCSPRHAATNVHMSQHSDTNATQQATRLDITQWVLLCQLRKTPYRCLFSSRRQIWCECSLTIMLCFTLSLTEVFKCNCSALLRFLIFIKC